jgi:hypothetical protein
MERDVRKASPSSKRTFGLSRGCAGFAGLGYRSCVGDAGKEVEVDEDAHAVWGRGSRGAKRDRASGGEPREGIARESLVNLRLQVRAGLNWRHVDCGPVRGVRLRVHARCNLVPVPFLRDACLHGTELGMDPRGIALFGPVTECPNSTSSLRDHNDSDSPENRTLGGVCMQGHSHAQRSCHAFCEILPFVRSTANSARSRLRTH